MGIALVIILSIVVALIIGRLTRFAGVIQTTHTINNETFRIIMSDGYPEDTRGYSEEKSMWYRLEYLVETPFDNGKWQNNCDKLNEEVVTEYNRICGK